MATAMDLIGFFVFFFPENKTLFHTAEIKPPIAHGVRRASLDLKEGLNKACYFALIGEGRENDGTFPNVRGFHDLQTPALDEPREQRVEQFS